MTEEIKTDFHVEVIKVSKVEKHPNADSLSICDANGFPCIIKTGSLSENDLAIYIPVDSCVPLDQPEFKFLDTGKGKEFHRIKAAKLRGIFSMGLLVPIRPGMALGQNVADIMGIKKYVSPSDQALEAHEARMGRVREARKERVKLPVYGLDNYRKYKFTLEPGERVVITEKIHGSSHRAVYAKNRLHVGSHKTMRGASRHKWVEKLIALKLKIQTLLGFKHRAHVFELGDVYWEIAEKYNLKEKLSKVPNLVLYGEVYGHKIQKGFMYDCKENERKFRAFDFYNLDTGKYLDYDEFVSICKTLDIPTVPELYREPWKEELWALTEGKSVLNPNHIKEGCVVKPVINRYDPKVGRVALKMVSNTYLLNQKDE